MGGRRGASVLDLVGDRVTVEQAGSLEPGSPRVALLAHWSAGPRVSRSFRELTAAFVRRRYQVLVVSAATCDEPLDWGPDGRRAGLEAVRVLRKPNVGYDFGSWAVALHELPWAARADHVVLANDSLVGPFAPIDHLLDAFEASRADVWGVTETLQFTRHVQSYFVGYRGGALAEAPLARFWRSVRHHDDKNDVIRHGELALGRLLQREGFAVDAACVARSVVPAGDNPTIAGWRRLLDRGIPFVKREIVRSPGLAPEGDQIRADVKRRYGADIEDWDET